MIEIGCQTYSLRTLPCAEMLVGARKAGFRAIELWAGHAPAGGAAATEVRRAADEIGLAIQAYAAGGFVRVGVASVEQRLAAAFAFAAALGVDLVTGVVDRRAVAAVDALCRRTGMRFGIENHWYADFARAEDFGDVLSAVSPLVGVTLDTGHLVAAGGDPCAALERLGARVFAVHLKDVVVPARLARWLARRPRMEGRTVGAGEARLAPFVHALAQNGDGVRVAIEDERPDLPLSELQASLRACTGMLRAAGRSSAAAATR
jgi:sugar phosphate isomerase/epimerase